MTSTREAGETEPRIIIELEDPAVRTIRQRLLSQAALFSNPDAYRAGVEDAFAALGDSTLEEVPAETPSVRMI